MFLAVSIIWLGIHLYGLPFHPWTLGMVRPWFMMNGLVPYRDFVWIRVPADLFVLTGWYSIVGVSPDSYRLFIATVLGITLLFLWRQSTISALVFSILFPPLFFNTEVGEMLIGLYATAFAYTFLHYMKLGRTRELFVSGILVGAMIMTKQSTATIPLMTLLVMAFHARGNNHTHAVLINRFVIFAAGVLVIPLCIGGYVIYHHALYDAYYYTVQFLLSTYTSAPVTKGTGLILTGSLLILGLPLMVLNRNREDTMQRLFLFGLLVCLTPLAYPSFLSYRTYPLLPVIALSAPYIYDITRIRTQKALIIVLCAVVFLYGTRTYFTEYHLFVSDNGIVWNQWLLDYADDEHEAAAWIQENTSPHDRILVYANSMIYLLSDRLPSHKYVDPFPYLLEPYEVTAQVFDENKPVVFIYDETLPDVHTGLASFPFIQTIQNDYELQHTIGTLRLYNLRSRSD